MLWRIAWLIGLWRIWWGFCPLCNSDAPELDTCPFCKSARGWKDRAARQAWREKWMTWWEVKRG